MFTILSLVNIAVGILLAVLAIPMIREKIKPNLFYGFRTKKTMSDEKIWYAANKYAGKCMVNAGFAIVILAAVSLIMNFTTDVFYNYNEVNTILLWSAILMLPIVAMLIASIMYLRKL
jgi:uncharacterized membrane protein